MNLKDSKKVVLDFSKLLLWLLNRWFRVVIVAVVFTWLLTEGDGYKTVFWVFTVVGAISFIIGDFK